MVRYKQDRNIFEGVTNMGRSVYTTVELSLDRKSLLTPVIRDTDGRELKIQLSADGKPPPGFCLIEGFDLIETRGPFILIIQHKLTFFYGRCFQAFVEIPACGRYGETMCYPIRGENETDEEKAYKFALQAGRELLQKHIKVFEDSGHTKHLRLYGEVY
jgi:hypothetical protein